MNPLFRNFYEAMKKAGRQEDMVRSAGELVRKVKSSRGGFRDLGQVRRGFRDVSRAVKTGDKLSYGRLSQFVKDTLWNEMMRALGPLGSIVGAMLRPNAQAVTQDIERELKAAADLLQHFGYEVSPPPIDQTGSGRGMSTPKSPAPAAQPMSPSRPPRPEPPPTLETPEPEPRQRPDHPTGVNGQRFRIRRDDPLLTGEMIKVKSSNVHSIGYLWNHEDPARGTLQVRFLDKRKGRTGTAGAGYHYFEVHPAVFVAFTKAASKGKFVWDRLRVRGTVSGHQYRYSLATLSSDGYVPRKARLEGGGYMIGPPGRHPAGRGEVFQRRTVTGANGRVYQSSLPERFVGFTRPNRGRPNRGEPNRGR